MDFIGKVENINEDLLKLSQILGMPLKEVQRKNYNRTIHDHYSKYYNDESIDNVRKFYKKDFEFFNYPMDDPLL